MALPAGFAYRAMHADVNDDQLSDHMLLGFCTLANQEVIQQLRTVVPDNKWVDIRDSTLARYRELALPSLQTASLASAIDRLWVTYIVHPTILENSLATAYRAVEKTRDGLPAAEQAQTLATENDPSSKLAAQIASGDLFALSGDATEVVLCYPCLRATHTTHCLASYY